GSQALWRPGPGLASGIVSHPAHDISRRTGQVPVTVQKEPGLTGRLRANGCDSLHVAEALATPAASEVIVRGYGPWPRKLNNQRHGGISSMSQPARSPR